MQHHYQWSIGEPVTSIMSLPNGYYLQQITYPEIMTVFPGNKLNHYFIYDVNYSEKPEKQTQLLYLAQDNVGLSLHEAVLDQRQNIIEIILQEPDVIICTEKSLSALFFYYKRFYKRKNYKPIIIIQTDELLPFQPVPSKILLPLLPSHVIASVPYFEDLNIPSRIASARINMPGWYEGNIIPLLNKQYDKILFI